VELVISDAHGGIKAAIAAVLGDASWQRCRTHFMANLATKIPKASWPMIATLVRSIFEQPDRDTTWEQLGDVVDKLTQAGFNDVAVTLLDAADDVLAFSAFPVEHWPKIRSNNPQFILSRGEDRCRDLHVCGVDGVIDAGVQHGPMSPEVFLCAGGSWRCRSVSRGWARLSPRASAKALRSRRLSASSCLTRAVEVSSR
ncbi:MAG: transposase, partial [Acidimicrobiales bacterium]